MPSNDESLKAARVEISGLPRKKGALQARIILPERESARHEGHEGPSYRWLTSDAKDGIYTPIAGAYYDVLPLSAAAVGRYVRCEAALVSGEERLVLTGEAIGPIADAEGNPNTDWLHDARYGISHHLLAEFMNRVAPIDDEKWRDGERWDEVIAGFDVDRYVEQVVESGAGFVILTLGQNSGYLLSPNATYDRIAGLQPGERASTRDLPLEIADALAPHGIKLILYVPANPPSKAHLEDGDNAINRAFDYPVEVAPSQETQAKWQAVIREWSDRYGEKLAGWWFDGMWFQEAYDDLTLPCNWYSLAGAAKSGNPSRIVAFNGGIFRDRLVNSRLEDYTAGETNEIGPLPPNGRWADEREGVQWFHWTFLGRFVTDLAGWGNTGLNWPTGELTDWVKSAIEMQGVIALDVHVNRFGHLDGEQREQLQAIKQAIRQGRVQA